MTPTIYEVAALAGVSPATVSRVLNGVAVSPAYADKVRKAADTLNFRPNRTARSLRRRSSEVIALIIPDIENPFFTALARAVEDHALAAGLSVVLCNSDEQPSKEARYLEVAVSEQMAGVIRRDGQRERRSPRDDRAVRARHPRRLHHRPLGRGDGRRRAAGWRSVFTDRSRRANPDNHIRYTNYRVDGGRQAMAQLVSMRRPPDAVFVANNLMSVGALQHLFENGQPPPQVGLASLGEPPFPTWQTQAVTVIPWPARQLGVEATDLLLAWIRRDDSPARTVVANSGGESSGRGAEIHAASSV